MKKNDSSQAHLSSHMPPYTMTPELVRLVATTSEVVGRFIN